MTGDINDLLTRAAEIFRKKELEPVFLQVAETSGFLWERGWAERNAGNFSINVTGLFTGQELDRISGFPCFPLYRNYPGLAGTLFLVSGSGTRMRDIAKNPREFVCFIYVGRSGNACQIIDGNPDNTASWPTSELATHMAVQQQLVQMKAPENVVLHAHVTELIALTQLPPFKSEESVNSLLWGMHPETMQVLPGGAGFIPFDIPGTENIAMATLKGFGKHKVVLWEKHGCMAVGSSLADAFDNIDILAKSAKIYFQCKSTGMEPQGLTNAQLKEIREYLQY